MAINLAAIVLLSMTIGISLVCMGFVIRGCLADAKWPSHALALGYFFFVMIVEASERLSQTLPNGPVWSGLQGMTLLVVPSLGACIWFYIRGLTSKAVTFGRADLWHGVPVAICIVAVLPFLALSADRQRAIMTPGGDLLEPELLIPILFLLVAWVTWLAILILYSGASLSRLIKHRRHIRDLYSQVEGVSLKWLHALIVIVLTCSFLVIASSFFPAISTTELFSPKVVAAFYFCVVFVFGLFGVLQKNTIPSWDELDQTRQPGRKYARSALQTTDLERIAKKLDLAMQDRRLWQNPNLSLLDMATETGVSQNNISQTLNEHLDVNFYDYVNSWRIDAARNALRATDHSVLTISEGVGFNAKSTFNAAFKKMTGQTPRQYRNAAAQVSSKPQE